jgi:L-ascorbate metabolism protein UlaG (beta-lactamase superfamily)
MTSISVTWWGHATTTIAIGGRRILTDPVMGQRLGHLSRIGGPAPRLEALQADLVVVSHLHFDHLDVPTLRRLDGNVRIVVPQGAARVLRTSAPGLARRFEEVRPGDTVSIDGVHVQAVPAHHDGRRWPWSRHQAPALGFVIGVDSAAASDHVWFAGDTGLFAGMVDLAPVRVAVVPIGGWGPTLGPKHLDPAQGAEAVRRVAATDAIPIHYGTFWPSGLRQVHPASFNRHFIDPGARFAEALATTCPGASAHVLRPGETVNIRGSVR